MLKEKRKAAGLTQQQLADAINVDRSTIAKIENGGLPSVPTAKKIASVLGFDWTLFFENVNPMKKKKFQ